MNKGNVTLYNAFGNVTSRQTFTWNQANNQTHTWTNNRESTWGYDPDGRLKFTPENYYAYNAAGAVMRSSLTNVNLIYHHTDGEGRSVRRDIYKQTNGYNTFEKTEYSIYSSVLGKALTDVKSDGAKKKTNVYGAGGQLVATQNAASTTLQHVAWSNIDPSSASYLPATHTGMPVYLGDDGQAELDPLGSNVQTSNPFDAERPPNLMQMPGGGGGWGNPFSSYGCWGGMPCSLMAEPSWWTTERWGAEWSGEDHFNWSNGIIFSGGNIGDLLDGPPLLPGIHTSGYWSEGRWVMTGFVVVQSANGPVSQQQTGEVRLSDDVKIGRKVSPKLLSEEDCNFLLNHLFGSLGSVAASGYEPKELGNKEVAGTYRAGQFGEFATNIHIYGDATGTRTGASLYAPANLDGTAPGLLTSYTGGSDFAEGQVTFYSGQYNEMDDRKLPPQWSNKFIFQYKNGLTISFAHVGGAYGGKSGANSIGKGFMRDGKLVGLRNSAGSYQIGFIGGPGGETDGYIHSHLAFWRDGMKINPRVEFCGGGSKF